MFDLVTESKKKFTSSWEYIYREIFDDICIVCYGIRYLACNLAFTALIIFQRFDKSGPSFENLNQFQELCANTRIICVENIESK